MGTPLFASSLSRRSCHGVRPLNQSSGCPHPAAWPCSLVQVKDLVYKVFVQVNRTARLEAINTGQRIPLRLTSPIAKGAFLPAQLFHQPLYKSRPIQFINTKNYPQSQTASPLPMSKTPAAHQKRELTDKCINKNWVVIEKQQPINKGKSLFTKRSLSTCSIQLRIHYTIAEAVARSNCYRSIWSPRCTQFPTGSFHKLQLTQGHCCG